MIEEGNERFLYGVYLERVGEKREATVEFIRLLTKDESENVRKRIENTPVLLFRDMTLESARSVQKGLEHFGNVVTVKKMDDIFREMLSEPEVQKAVNKKNVKSAVLKLIGAVILSIILIGLMLSNGRMELELKDFIEILSLSFSAICMYAVSLGSLIQLAIERRNKMFSYTANDERKTRLQKEIQKFQKRKLRYDTMEKNIRSSNRTDLWETVICILVADTILGLIARVIWNDKAVYMIVIGIGGIVGLCLGVAYIRAARNAIELVIGAARQSNISYLDVKHDFMQGTTYRLNSCMFHISPKYSMFIDYILRDSWIIENSKIICIEKYAPQEVKSHPIINANQYVLKFCLKDGEEYNLRLDNLKASVILYYYQQQEIDTIDRFPYVWKRIKN